MLRKKIIQVIPYPFKIIFLDWTYEEANEYLSESFWQTIEQWNSCCYLFNWNAYIYTADDKIPTLVHEIIHWVQMCYKDIWIETGEENTEILAYTVEYILINAILFYTKAEKIKKHKKI